MKQKRKPWSRRAKIVRNLLLAALLGLMMWDAWGWPSFSFHADLRRRERQMLFPEPEAAVELELFYGNPFRVEVAENKAVMSMATRGSFFTVAHPSIYTLREGPDLLAIPYTICVRDKAGQRQEWVVYAAFHPPEGSDRAALTIYSDTGNLLLTAEGVREEQMFLFYTHPEEVELWAARLHETLPEGYTYKLAFYDGDNDILQEITG